MNEIKFLGCLALGLFFVLCLICIVQDWQREKRRKKNGKFNKNGDMKK